MATVVSVDYCPAPLRNKERGGAGGRARAAAEPVRVVFAGPLGAVRLSVASARRLRDQLSQTLFLAELAEKAAAGAAAPAADAGGGPPFVEVP